MAVLVRNPDLSEGRPPYALADRSGNVQRYVEPTPGIDLESHVGTQVRVKHDTGETLLATQLELPVTPAGIRGAHQPKPFAATGARPIANEPQASVQRAQFEDDPNTDPIVLEDVIGEEQSVLPGPANRPEDFNDTDSFDANGSGTSDLRETLPPPSGDASYRIDGEPWIESHGASSVAIGGQCPHCGVRGGCQGPTCNPPSRVGPYGRIGYVLWWFDGMNVPPLVTGGTPASQGVLGADGTVVRNSTDVLDDARNGGRVTIGYWLDNQRDFAIEGDALLLGNESETFAAGDITGATLIARPYFDVASAANASWLVSFPATTAGSVSVTHDSEFDAYGLRLRTGLACRELGGGCASGQCGGCPSGVSRVDFFTGYRYATLEEGITIRDSRVAIGTAPANTYTGVDRFHTENDFHGIDLGFISEWETRHWSVELLSRLAVGRTSQKVSINGSGVLNGAPQSGSLLAQPSNIGSYERDRFGVLPELSARVAYRVSPRLRVGVAYSLIYWANVARPGDQIDLDVNLPQPASHPQFAFHETSLWAHGLTFSLDGEY